MSRTTGKPVFEEEIETAELKKGAEAAEIEEEEMKAAEALHGVINPREAERYVQILNKILNDLGTKVRDDRVKDIMKDALAQFKDTITRVVPQIGEADVTKVLGSVVDPRCLALMPRTKEREQLLEEVMPLEDIPSGSTVISSVEEIMPLTDNQWDI